MAEYDERLAELMGAALAGDLNDAERAELEAACAADPALREELTDLRAAASAVRASGITWVETQPPADLGARIRERVAREEAGAAHDELEARRSPRGRGIRLAVAAAALLIVGGGLGQVVTGHLDAPPEGPPGTLGAVEQITFAGVPAGTTVAASLVAHTWGTETLLEIDGAALGETFEVLLLDHDGVEYDSGSFIGTEATVVCAMNAAVLREDVSTIQIVGADGSTLGTSDLVPVAG